VIAKQAATVLDTLKRQDYHRRDPHYTTATAGIGCVKKQTDVAHHPPNLIL
jgi:hypothetical protein